MMKFVRLRALVLAFCLAATGLAAQTTVVASGSTPAPTIDSTWWKHAVIYEIYPRSFQDSNGDGIGDLNGITERLDYLQALGVDAIWISPMYPSPQVDFGYDISDYENVDPQYGTLKDFDRLVAEAKKRNIRVILDMVLNHTSDKHKWFIESASSRKNAKRDWYMWSNGKDGGKPGPNGKPVPPNNWESLFGGSAWEYMPQTKSFYYHKFYKQQPDLNWSNPAVEKAMFGSMQFWLDRGVAGYRLDAIPTLFEDPQLRDEPVLGGTNAQGDPNLDHIYTDNLPAVHGVIRRMRAMVTKYPASNYPGDRVLIGETYLPNTAELDKWYGGAKKDELQLPMDMIVGFSNKLDANTFRARISEVETQVHGSQPLLVFDNHDNIRSWERYGDGVHNVAIAKLIATMLFTTHATALMYYGEELGMTTSTPTRVEDVRDPIGRTGWPKEKGRDGERTPMQWDASAPQAGFSTSATTWLPVASNYKTVNVKTELADPNSLLNWHKQLIEMRRKRDAVRDGGMVMLDTANPSVLSYVRTAPPGHHNIVVALNMTGQPQKIALDLKEAGIQQTAMKTLMTNEPSLMGATTTSLTLPPFASWVGEVQMQ
jgi:alpha-glucosidase